MATYTMPNTPELGATTPLYQVITDSMARDLQQLLPEYTVDAILDSHIQTSVMVKLNSTYSVIGAPLRWIPVCTFVAEADHYKVQHYCDGYGIPGSKQIMQIYPRTKDKGTLAYNDPELLDLMVHHVRLATIAAVINTNAVAECLRAQVQELKAGSGTSECD